LKADALRVKQNLVSEEKVVKARINVLEKVVQVRVEEGIITQRVKKPFLYQNA
jgi:hypothetical protein